MGVGLFYQVTNGRMSANGQETASSCATGGFDGISGKNFFTESVKPWNMLSREVMESLSLQLSEKL